MTQTASIKGTYFGRRSPFGLFIGSGKNLIDRRVVRLDPVEELKEGFDFIFNIARIDLRIERRAKPSQPDVAVN